MPILFVVMAFFIVWLVCWFPLGITTALVLNWKPNEPIQPEQKLPFILSLYLISPLVLWFFVKFVKIPFDSYGLAYKISFVNSLVCGFTTGIVSIFLIFAFQIWLGMCNFNKPTVKQLISTVVSILFIALLIGGIEEVIFRGFVYSQLQSVYGIWIGAIASSLIFAGLHLVWEQKETAPQLPGLWLMGMVLVFAKYVDSGNISLAWGLHAGWVWAMACIDTLGAISYTDKAPQWLVGKYQKPLAGFAGIFCMICTGLVLYVSQYWL